MRYSLTTAAVMVAVFLVIPATTLAQVEVVESSPTIRPIGQPRTTVAQPAADDANARNMQTEMYYQLQTLQQEVAALRGLVEEQAHEIEQLKQQRTDDYRDLDQRLSELAGGGAGGSGTAAGGGTPPTAPAAATRSGTSGEGELVSYNGAMDLIRAKQYDDAIESFNDFLSQYPGGQYAPNSYHWLGQLYQLRGKLPEAEESYNKVITDYPDHAKAADAKLKLGQLLFQTGEKARAKALLEEVASSGTDEARLASSFLQENF